MKTRRIFSIGLFVLSALTVGSIQAQSGLLSSLPQDERESVEAIALYPEEQQIAILEVSQYPEILVRMERFREYTESDFKALLEPLSAEDQKKVFDLSRYPDLIASISSEERRKSNKEMDVILKDYPVEIHETAKYLNKNQFKTLQGANELYLGSQEAFNKMIAKYPPNIQESFQTLVGLPEIITILTDNMSSTVLLGDIYKNNPETLKKELAELSVKLAEENTKELNEWKESLENDPEAKAEYEKASKEFAEEEGYKETNIQQTTTNVYVNYVWRPYPYWFGYPWWYSYECWYPYPWWYHWGYYYGPNRTIVVIGLPSPYYMNWHFHHGHHLYRYPHFTNHMIRHHHKHPNSHTSVARSVQRWETKERTNLPKKWLNDDLQRVERIKEYGKFKMDHQSLQESGKRVPTEQEYLRNNADKYPTLKGVSNQSTRKEEVKINRKETSPVYSQPRKPTTKQNTNTTRDKVDYPTINNAKTIHKNTWDRPKPTNNTSVKPSNQRPVTSPKPVRKTPVTTSPKRNVSTPTRTPTRTPNRTPSSPSRSKARPR